MLREFFDFFFLISSFRKDFSLAGTGRFNHKSMHWTFLHTMSLMDFYWKYKVLTSFSESSFKKSIFRNLRICCDKMTCHQGKENYWNHKDILPRRDVRVIKKLMNCGTSWKISKIKFNFCVSGRRGAKERNKKLQRPSVGATDFRGVEVDMQKKRSLGMEADVCGRNRSTYQLPASSSHGRRKFSSEASIGYSGKTWQEECMNTAAKNKTTMNIAHNGRTSSRDFWCDEAEVYRKTWGNRTPMSGLQQLFCVNCGTQPSRLIQSNQRNQVQFHAVHLRTRQRRSTCAPALHILSFLSLRRNPSWFSSFFLLNMSVGPSNRCCIRWTAKRNENQGGLSSVKHTVVARFLWANNYWITSHPKKLLEHMMKELIRGGSKKMGSGTHNGGKPVVVKYICRRCEGGHDDQDVERSWTSFRVLRNGDRNSWVHLHTQAGKSHESLEEFDGCRKPTVGVTWRCKDFQKQRCAVWPSVLYNDSLEWEGRSETLQWPFLSEIIAESLWRAMGWIWDQRPNACSRVLNRSLSALTVEKYKSFEHVDDWGWWQLWALRSVCRPASDPKQSTKRDGQNTILKSVSEIDSGLTGSAFSFLLFFKSVSTPTSLLRLLFPACFRVPPFFLSSSLSLCLSSSSFLVFFFFFLLNMSVGPNNHTTTVEHQREV